MVRLIRRLCIVALIQIMLFLDHHTVGISIIVGIIVFSIVEGLGFGRNLCHMC